MNLTRGVLIFFFALNCIFAAQTRLQNPENREKVLNRQKRFLIFPQGGVAKFVSKLFMILIVN